MQILSTQLQSGAQAQLGLQGVECVGGEVAWKPVEAITCHLFPEVPHLDARPSLTPACVCRPRPPRQAACSCGLLPPPPPRRLTALWR